MRKGIGEDRSREGHYAWWLVPWFRAAGLVRTTALPGAGFVPYAGAVPDGGRHGFEAAKTVASPHRLAA